MLKRCTLVFALALSACGGAEVTDGQVDELSLSATPHLLPFGLPDPAARAPLAHLDYYGGRVLGNVEVVAVLWGSKVNPDIRDGIGNFYSAAVGSTYFDWLSEYNTDIAAMNGDQGTGQTLGRGSLTGVVTITPKNKAQKLTDRAIERELASQIGSGKLPKPHPDTVYMLSFPPGIQIDLGGAHSCESGGFCAYHSAFKRGGKAIAYGVLPDFSPGSGCDTGCGGAGRQFDNQTAVASHELIEAVTDPDVGLAGKAIGPPIAWYDAQRGEIGDVCNGKHGKLHSKGGKSYVVQKEWSNKAKACVVSHGRGGADAEAQELEQAPRGE